MNDGRNGTVKQIICIKWGAKFGPEFDWHSHPVEDEAFLVLRGRIAIEFRDGVVELGQGDFLCVPRGVEHRPRALSL